MCKQGTCVSSFNRQQDSFLRKVFRKFEDPNKSRRKPRRKVRTFTATA